MRKTTTTRIRRRRIAAPAACLSLAVLALSGQPATAEPVTCGARDAIVERLAVTHEERPVSRGVTATGSLLEVLASPAGTWTVIVTIPGGPTCLVSTGEGWHENPIQLAEEPAV